MSSTLLRERENHSSVSKSYIQSYASPQTESSTPNYAPPETNTFRKPITILRRLGWYSVFALLTGTAIILGCAGFLCFLWMGDARNIAWRRIVVAGWITRLITISALLLRVAVTTQAAVCTSMLAALYLNSFEVPLPNAAAMSLMRFSNTGPRSLISYLPRSVRFKSLFLGLIVLLMTCTTILLQFTSTALLSDVGNGVVSGLQIDRNITYGFNGSNPLGQQVSSTGYLGTRPALYPAFAEYTEPAVSPIEGVVDTGLSLRAFLPIDSKESRESLKNFSGIASLVDTRVVCMRPVLDELQVSAILGDPKVSGTIRRDFDPPRFNRTEDDVGVVPFTCTFAVQGILQTQYSTTHEWPLVLCLLNITTEGMISEMEPLILPPSIGFNPGLAYLLINTTGKYSEWGPINNAGGRIPITEEKPHGPWATMLTNVTELSFSFTLCYTKPVILDTQIDAYRNSNNNTEPTSGWDSTTVMFKTEAIRRQLGATSQPFTSTERGIFNLARKVSWEGPSTLNYTETGFTVINTPTLPETTRFAALLGMEDTETSVMACGWCQPGGKITTARVHSAVMNDILQDTGNPALALQSLITTLFGMAYYDHVFQFDIPAPASLVSDVLVILPNGWRFFGAVMAVLALHLALVVLLTLIFVFDGQNSLLGNAWSAIAQVRGGELNNWAKMAGGMTDGDVKKDMKNLGVERTLVGVTENRGLLIIKRR